ncbi:MAG: tripartite tricarboxylate transporter substrate binding protein [Pseudolabrys sp.]|nr:tripartite tricarboxylate transporter substrate binding protein [Pseudolabrys sp.]
MQHKWASILHGVIVGLTVALMPAAAQAQAWPTAQPIKVIVPFTAGSGTDLVARAVFDQVSVQLGQTIIIENRGGAGGTLGVNAVAKAAPDGYTLLAHSSSHTVSAVTFSQLPYDAVKDLKAIIPLANLPNVLVVATAKGYKTAKDMVAAAKAKPGSFNYATAGAGTASHFNAERFKQAAKFEATHVPFKGGPEALREVLSERCDFYFVPYLPAKGLVEAGQLQVLAVSSSQRASALPNVPTTVEAGFPDSEFNFWVGALAPSQTPAPILDRLHAEISKALANPDVREKLARLGADPMPMSAADFEALIVKEIAQNRDLVKAAGIKVN